MTTDLVAFLTARLDEDEAPARRSYDEASDYDIRGTDATLDHFANWKPERVLAEVAAKRQILEHRRRIDRSHNDGEWSMGYSDANYEALRALAQPFASHPDFDESWRV